MGLMKKIFGAGITDTGSAVLPFSESQLAAGHTRSRNDPRRELVQVVLRDTMRKHGIPSDWIDCRTLAAVNRDQKSGVHVQFVVRKGDDQLLNYVHAFQESFREEIGKFDAQAAQWIFSVAWQFEGKATRNLSAMPEVGSWSNTGDPPRQDAVDTQPYQDDEANDLESDLHALQALMSQSAELSNLPPAKPRAHRSSGKS
jgi:hypothetical protein